MMDTPKVFTEIEIVESAHAQFLGGDDMWDVIKQAVRAEREVIIEIIKAQEWKVKTHYEYSWDFGDTRDAIIEQIRARGK